MASGVTVALVCGQGTITIEDGVPVHHAEFPADAGVQLGHARWCARELAAHAPDLAVLSGGRTKPATPERSEAESFLDLWDAEGTAPPTPVVLDDLALDSAENLILGLVAARLGLGGALTPVDPRGAWRTRLDAARLTRADPTLGAAPPIVRVLVLTAWRVKTLRFTLGLEELGVPDYEVRGFADSAASADSSGAAWGEAAGFARIVAERDPLLLGPAWEAKRRARHQGPGAYEARLAPTRAAMARSFAALDALRATPGDDVARATLRAAFGVDVLGRAV